MKVIVVCEIVHFLELQTFLMLHVNGGNAAKGKRELCVELKGDFNRSCSS